MAEAVPVEKINRSGLMPLCLKRLNEKGYVVLIDVTLRGHSPQQVINGRADHLLRDMADAIKLANVSVMLAYPREPELQPRVGFDGGGYGPRQQVEDRGRRRISSLRTHRQERSDVS